MSSKKEMKHGITHGQQRQRMRSAVAGGEPVLPDSGSPTVTWKTNADAIEAIKKASEATKSTDPS